MFDKTLIKTYLVYSCVLVLKLVFMAVLTVIKRLENKAYHTAEDAVYLKSPMKSCDEVERIRKCHLNDLENNSIFLVAALAYLTTNPNPIVATWLFRAFVSSRFVHMFVYVVVVVPQPARAYSWLVGFFTTIYMAFVTVCYYAAYL